MKAIQALLTLGVGLAVTLLIALLGVILWGSVIWAGFAVFLPTLGITWVHALYPAVAIVAVRLLIGAFFPQKVEVKTWEKK